jgi:hypothetical protein
MTSVGPVTGGTTGGYGAGAWTPLPPAGGAGRRQGDQRRRRPQEWHEVLTELEGEVLAAEDSLARGRADEIASWGRRTTDWIPPVGLGPLPVDLRERAMHLLQHQLAIAEALVERITQSQKQRDVAARMSYGPTRPVASFIDRAL